MALIVELMGLLAAWKQSHHNVVQVFLYLQLP